jgi:hypothetical protein
MDAPAALLLLLQALCALLAAALLAALLLPPPPLPSGVPHVRGLPLLGSLLAFGRDTSGFIARQSRAHGAAWAAHLLRGPCLFLTQPVDFAFVWRHTRELSFHEVELDMNAKVLGLAPAACAAAVDGPAHGLWTKHLAGGALPPLARNLARVLFREASPAPRTVATRALSRGEAALHQPRDAAARAAARAAETPAAAEAAASEWRSCDLYDFVYRLLWAGGVRTVIGDIRGGDDDDDRDDSDEGGVAQLVGPFRAFDAAFPLLAGGVPAALLPDAVAARTRLTVAMEAAVTRAEKAEKAGADADADVDATTAGREARIPALSGLVRDRGAHFASCGVSSRDAATLNGLLAWPLHANSAPAAFWALAHVLAEPTGDALTRITSEVDAFMAAHPSFPNEDASVVPITAALLDAELPFATACVHEALRLCVSSIGLRIATEEVAIPIAPHTGRAARIATVLPGTRVFLASTHHSDEARFPDAARFRPARFLPGGGATPGDVLPFGGGASMCPGRHFALVELRLLLLAVLSTWQLRLCGPLPALHARRAGLGVLPPAHDVRAQFRLRNKQAV